jgi:endonuclease/exonuclease/phosphatase family metal-dependent hydrolase
MMLGSRPRRTHTLLKSKAKAMVHQLKDHFLRAAAVAALALFSVSMPAHGQDAEDDQTWIVSWNVKRMSMATTDLDAVSDVLKSFDLVALQEVMEEEVATVLLQNLQEKTFQNWGYLVSHAIGRGSYKERYVFLWKRSEVEYVDSAVTYIDDEDRFAREPVSARFQTKDGETFILGNVHILYGENEQDRTPEIKALRSYWDWLGKTFPDEQYFVAGDFNMAPSDQSFDLLRDVALPVITEGGTTLSTRDGQYANLYDNIWIPNNLQAEITAGVLDLSTTLQRTHADLRENVSDHAPVFMSLANMNETSGLYAATFDPQTLVTAEEAMLVRGNKSSGIFHLPECPNYDDMRRSENLVPIPSVEEALALGYRKAGNCP